MSTLVQVEWHVSTQERKVADGSLFKWMWPLGDPTLAGPSRRGRGAGWSSGMELEQGYA